jgi:thioredoxin-related protein
MRQFAELTSTAHRYIVRPSLTIGIALQGQKMAKSITQRLEFFTNLAIIVAAVLLSVVLIKIYLLPNHSKDGPRDWRVPAGVKVSLPGVDWSNNKQTLLLVLQKGCHFCTESAPFYQRLVRETAGRGSIHLIAVLPKASDESKKYLDDLGVAIEEVKQAELDSIGVHGTPTLILVNDQGVVMTSWVGKLSADGEADVLRRLHEKTL